MAAITICSDFGVRRLVITSGLPGYSKIGSSSEILSLITSTELLLPGKLAPSQAWGIIMWTSLGACCSVSDINNLVPVATILYFTPLLLPFTPDLTPDLIWLVLAQFPPLSSIPKLPALPRPFSFSCYVRCCLVIKSSGYFSIFWHQITLMITLFLGILWFIFLNFLFLTFLFNLFPFLSLFAS